MAGHSKWAQIRHKKALTDARRSQLFAKLVREITLTARQGGTRPETNAALRSAIERGRSQGLPKENIERAITRASGRDATSLQEFLYEATAAGGLMLLIEGITDNKNRTLAQVKHLLAEHGAKLADPGAVMWSFEKVGTLALDAAENASHTGEAVELAIIESGASDFKRVDEAWTVETPFALHEKVRRSLEERGIRLRESGHDYKARTPLTLSEEVRRAIEPLLESLIAHDDIQEVYTNLVE